MPSVAASEAGKAQIWNRVKNSNCSFQDSCFVTSCASSRNLFRKRYQRGWESRTRLLGQKRQCGAVEESCSLGIEHKMGGKLHLKLNMTGRPIANKYREGKMKRTLRREWKVPEIECRERNKPSRLGEEKSAGESGSEEGSALRWLRYRKSRSPLWASFSVACALFPSPRSTWMGNVWKEEGEGQGDSELRLGKRTSPFCIPCFRLRSPCGRKSNRAIWREAGRNAVEKKRTDFWTSVFDFGWPRFRHLSSVRCSGCWRNGVYTPRLETRAKESKSGPGAKVGFSDSAADWALRSGGMKVLKGSES